MIHGKPRSRSVILFLASTLTPLSAACSSLAERPPHIDTRAPAPGCGDCFVVNASMSGAGSNLFIGGYTELDGGVIRRFKRGGWDTLLDSSQLGDVRQLWATDDALYFVARAGVHRMDLEKSIPQKLDVEGSAVWSAGSDDVVVLSEEASHHFDGNDWTDHPLAIGKPAALSGSSRSDLYALGDDGRIAHLEGEAFELLGEQPPSPANDIWNTGDVLLAVSGDDRGDRKTGPGAIMRFVDGQWSVLHEAPLDALLAVASAGPDRIYAVGATRANGGAHPVIWRGDGDHWKRRVITTIEAFLWDVWCDADANCHASGTDNVFLDLSDFE